ncbi:MAG TPA: 2-oxo acid dehydrogenase subunit E2 [Pirellulales bacterium]|jgi:pyruvate dehydrogenase E2 component (dihydrolipoamide acetyltransferase)|nr:2-oxo acid dehydrogenase subunit E2 [Pirellulales bacterium]
MPDFKLPDLGENIASGDVVSLLVKEGDVVKPQQEVIEVETEKAVIPVPTPLGGRVTKIHIKPGDTVKVGQVLLSLEEAALAATAKPQAAPSKPAAKAESPAKAAPKPAPAKPAPSKAEAPREKPRTAAPAAERPTPAPTAKGDNGRSAAPMPPRAAPLAAPQEPEDETPAEGPPSPAGPAVRRLARELGVELSRVRGTGPDGRILREDVIAAVRHATSSAPAAPPTGTQDRDAWGPIRREAMPKIRKTIAANMVRSAFTIPHLTNFDDADITELERIRKGSVADYAGSNAKLTSLVFVMKAVALSLRQHPMLNASLDMENGQIIYKDYVNLGIAVDTPRGLVVPVVRDVDKLTIPHIAQSLTTLAEKAKATQYTLDDLRGGSFTISNLGAIGGTYSTPIINFPEVAVLLLGRSRKLPVVVEDRIEPRLMMPLSLSYDHRLVDGAAAARFLNEVIGYLQSPGRLLLAP